MCSYFVHTNFHVLAHVHSFMMASQKQKQSGGQTSEIAFLRTNVRQMEECIIELENVLERIDALEERLEQTSLNPKEDCKDVYTEIHA